MKQTLLLITCLMFCGRAFCQTLSIDDLTQLCSKPDLKAFLASKAYQLCADCSNGADSTIYYKNKGAADEENLKIWAGKKTVHYQTPNSEFIAGLLYQMKIEYPVVHKDATDKAYQKQYNAEVSKFGDPLLKITVYVYKDAKKQGLVMVEQK